MSFSFNARKKISTLQKDFKKEFGLTIRIYDGSSFADIDKTILEVRKTKGSSENLAVAKNMRVGSLENKIIKEYGLKVQIAGSDDSYLCENELTLKAAKDADDKKMGRKKKKDTSKKEIESDDDKDELDNVLDEMMEEYGDGNDYFINCDKSRDASMIEWANEDYNIHELEPYISSIDCDDGEDFHYLMSEENEFKLISLDKFEAIEGDDENQFLLCFTAVVNINLDKYPDFKKALDKSDNMVVARIGFKKNGKEILNSDGYEEHLFEMGEDVPVELELDD